MFGSARWRAALALNITEDYLMHKTKNQQNKA